MKAIEDKLNLITLSGVVTVPLNIVYDDDKESVDSKASIDIVYDGLEYAGKGSDYLLMDAFADLQRSLPEGVALACCISCRHGQMCPYGNTPNQLFCTKDKEINSKKDICKLFDSHEDAFRWAVRSFDYCDSFVYQSNDSYTYNDYLIWLEEHDKQT